MDRREHRVDDRHLQPCEPRHRCRSVPGFAAMGSKQTGESPLSMVKGMIRRVTDVSNCLPKLRCAFNMHRTGSDGARWHSRFGRLLCAGIIINPYLFNRISHDSAILEGLAAGLGNRGSKWTTSRSVAHPGTNMLRSELL